MGKSLIGSDFGVRGRTSLESLESLQMSSLPPLAKMNLTHETRTLVTLPGQYILLSTQRFGRCAYSLCTRLESKEAESMIDFFL